MVSSTVDMQNNKASSQLTGLARFLVRNKLLEEKVALDAIAQAKKDKVQLVSYIIQHELASSEQIAWVAAKEFNLPLFDLDVVDPSAMPTDLVEEKLITKHNALPLMKRGNRLFVGLSDPTNLHALEDFKFQTGLHTEPVIVLQNQLDTAIKRLLEQPSEALQSMLDDDLDNIDISHDDGPADEPAQSGDDDAPVVRFVNKVLLDAINRGASDLHFEPYEGKYRVRFRQDGVLSEVTRPPATMAPRISARLKVMSQLDIAERRVPQDGRMKMHLSKQRAIDFRVSTCPTLYGEKIVMRILDPTSAQLGIDALGYEPEQKQLYLNAIAKPQGMVLVTGPTGSGKTVSLYTGLNILNTETVNISTAEDPVEINLAGINQVNVNTKTGMTFSRALKAFLRQDPDIIMVGEIRDLETGEIAIKAAQTGHLVMSTLHTNDAPQTLTRMMNMGIAAYNIASSVHLIIAQRLGRRLCNNCKELDDVPEAALVEMGFDEDAVNDGFEVFKAVGCDQCNSGYKGRVGIYQVMPVTEQMGHIMMTGGNAMDIAKQAQQDGINDLRQSGLMKVQQGVTSLEEINRVTKD